MVLLLLSLSPSSLICVIVDVILVVVDDDASPACELTLIVA